MSRLNPALACLAFTACSLDWDAEPESRDMSPIDESPADARVDAPGDGGEEPPADAGRDDDCAGMRVGDACVPVEHCRGITSCQPGTCIEADGGYTCDCPDGFEGDGTGACQCPVATRPTDDGKACRAPAWSEPAPLLESLSPRGDLVFVRADDGSAAVVWGDGAMSSANVLKGLSYLPGSGWASTVREVTNLDANFVVASALPGGGAVCMTSRGSSNFPVLYSTVLRPAGFEAPRRHDEAFFVDGSYGQQLAGNGSGRVLATWYTYDTPDIRAHGYVDEFVEGTGWAGPRQLAEGPSVPFGAVDDAGRALLAYAGSFATRQNGIWGPFRASSLVALPVALNEVGQGVGGVSSLSTFSFDAGWGEPVAMGSTDSALTRIDAQGRMLTVWVEGNSVRYRYFADGAWSEPDSVYDDSSPPVGLRLSMNARGDAIAAWREPDSLYRVRAQLFIAGLGWQFVQVVSMRIGHGVSTLWMDVKIDEQGDALMVLLDQGDDAENGPRKLYTASFH